MAVGWQRKKLGAVETDKGNKGEKVLGMRAIMRPIEKDEEKNNEQEDDKGELIGKGN